jgi:diguanylate cyclase (GGDEF)-like protein
MQGMTESSPPGDNLAAALIESRARWRDFALMAADLVFETDAAGLLTFLAPEDPLGHVASAWLGRPAEALLAVAGPSRGTRQAMRGAKAWLRRGDGTPVCIEFTIVPFGVGVRGIGRDVTAEERLGEVSARALRRATALGRLLRLGQRQAGPMAALEAMLGALPAALACAGAALLLAGEGGWQPAEALGASAPLHRLPPTGAPEDAGLALAGVEAGPALLAWRAEGQPPFDADDRDLLAALAMPVAALWTEALRLRELAEEAHGDALTGLLNRRGFTRALAERLRAGDGALVFIDVDGLKPLNDQLGHEAGDAALRGMAQRMRSAAMARDLAARLGGDEFCLWLDGAATEATARARAGTLGAPGPLPGWPQAGDAALRASLGIAVPDVGETVESLLMRADAAMYVAKRAGQRERGR